MAGDPMPAAPDPRIARDAFRRIADLERQVQAGYPNAWADMDRLRTGVDAVWPEWCLVPMAAAVAVGTSSPRWTGPLATRPYAAIAALYAWRYTRSVYVVEPGLLGRLMDQVPDAVNGVEDVQIPEWCVYIAAAHPEFPGAGLYAHLEHDMNTGRPELRLLLDPTGAGDLLSLLPIPVYLDRGSVVEALADFRATTAATDTTGRAGIDVHGGQVDAGAATLADRVDAYVSLLMYLSRPEADIRQPGNPNRRPGRYRSVPRDRTVWHVGYSDL